MRLLLTIFSIILLAGVLMLASCNRDPSDPCELAAAPVVELQAPEVACGETLYRAVIAVESPETPVHYSVLTHDGIIILTTSPRLIDEDYVKDYLWRNDSLYATFVTPGTYTARSTDGSMCVKETEFTIAPFTDPQCSSSLELVAYPETSVISCGSVEHTLKFKLNGATRPVDFTVESAGHEPYLNTSTDFVHAHARVTHLNDSLVLTIYDPGTFTIQASDCVGCGKSSTFTTVTPNTPLFPTVTEMTLESPTQCNPAGGTENGKMVLTVIGGAPPYEVRVIHYWPLGQETTIHQFDQTLTLENMKAGSYLPLEIKDSQGCRPKAQLLGFTLKHAITAFKIAATTDFTTQTITVTDIEGGPGPYKYHLVRCEQTDTYCELITLNESYLEGTFTTNEFTVPFHSHAIVVETAGGCLSPAKRVISNSGPN